MLTKTKEVDVFKEVRKQFEEILELIELQQEAVNQLRNTIETLHEQTSNKGES